MPTESVLATIDIPDVERLTAALLDFRPTTVYHLAALHFIPACESEPTLCVSVNVVGTERLLFAAGRTESIQRVVVASSAAVYEPSGKAHREDSALGPTDLYGHTKLWTESLTRLFHERVGIPIGIARLFNVFGPGETNPHLIPTMLDQASESSVLRLGNLDSRRDYVHVRDVARALVRIGALGHEDRSVVLNVGSERDVSGWDLVAILERTLGRRIPVEIDTARIRRSDRPRLLSDCDQAGSLLGWRASIALEDGLAELAKASGMRISQE